MIKQSSGAAGTERLDAAYSLRAEEQRQAAKVSGKQRGKQKSSRPRRKTTQEKLDRAKRTVIVLSEGFAIEDCRLLCSSFCRENRPSDHIDAVERDSINLACEIVRLMSANELFTFVKVPGVSGTNNESERTLRAPPPKIGEPTKPAAASAALVAAPSWPACWNRSARDSPRST